MKIKTITCHNVDNHGADLQAYALMKYLKSLGNDVEIIDYRPEYFKHFRPFVCSTPKYSANLILKFAYICAKFPDRVKAYIKYKKSTRKASFEDFRLKYYTTTEIYKSFEELKKNPPEADLYIAGSDQIWNTMMNNGRDPAFYLQFAKENAVTAAYAASFSVSELPQELKPQIKQRIERLDYVSVREKSAIGILENLGIHNAKSVLDPVFLLNKEQWHKIEADVDFDESYILVYDFEGTEEVKNFATEYAKKHNVKIYSLYNNAYCDKSFEVYGPDMFLSLIKNADFVLSNSFHATAFSLIYEKEFCVIKRLEGINSRMIDLLDSVGISGRIVSEYRELAKTDYSAVKELLATQINASKSFLSLVLKGAAEL